MGNGVFVECGKLILRLRLTNSNLKLSIRDKITIGPITCVCSWQNFSFIVFGYDRESMLQVEDGYADNECPHLYLNMRRLLLSVEVSWLSLWQLEFVAMLIFVGSGLIYGFIRLSLFLWAFHLAKAGNIGFTLQELVVIWWWDEDINFLCILPPLDAAGICAWLFWF